KRDDRDRKAAAVSGHVPREGAMKIKFFVGLCFAVLFLAATSAVAWRKLADQADQQAITQQELVRRTQELFDSVAPGNAEPFKKYFAEDAMFFDEKGRDMDKAALVKDLQPLPKGYSGTIKLVRPKSHIEGNIAILSYDLDETETVFGQNMTAR